MRFHLLGLALMASAAAPAIAQRAEPIDRRVDRIEQQLRAVQRRVFPSGQLAEPEIPAEVQSVMGGPPGGTAINNLTARVDALESQLRSLTNQIEEANNRSQRNAGDVAALRADIAAIQAARVEEAQAASAPPPRTQASNTRTRPAAQEPAAEEPTAEPAPAPARVVDDAEEAYNVGYRLWSQRRYAEAQGALGDVATRFPNSRWASWARNLQGRSYLDDNKPATAARILLANYQDNPRGERAPDSLFYLGQALTRLDRMAEACRVYDELASVYPDMRDTIRTRLPEARSAARCSRN